VVNYQFPRDEFDNYDARPTPVGVHRAPRSGWSRVWPFLLVAALFASVAIVGMWSLTRHQDVTDEPTASPTVVVSPEDNGAEPTEPTEPGNGEGEGNGEDVIDEANVDKAATIRVLNDTGPAGEAGRGRDRLTAAGFTNAVADNFPGDSGLTESSVWYMEGHHDTALAVADALGIPHERVIDHAVTGANIAVVIRGALPTP